MNIRLFNKPYIIRRFGEQSEVKGYLTADHEDFLVSMDVSPSGTDVNQALPEGERRIKRLQGFSETPLRVSNQDEGIQGDLLYYHGDWYECVSAQEWDHTILCHWNYSFTLVPYDAAGTIDTEDMPWARFNL